ncbi:hypothetical protein [Synoicihabitans lomoniglobus]|uniref:Carboxypeptidase regulatory-like domain-containing protein n=1 Tax=Synoicihabitans lomoniglobus TaxID=2909285 RepID=A0AAE9ZY93_9BACT|nr:hypothetical protein [Opitutaceae bacterium LMO-M01]WED63388.1 hypothetical protein PXH66_13700 [Opitutaceae bacterium LMO-M01]
MRFPRFLTIMCGLLSASVVSFAAIDLRINLGTNGPDGNWIQVGNSIDTFPAIDFATGNDTGARVSTLLSAFQGGNGDGSIVEDWLPDLAEQTSASINRGAGSVNITNLPAGTYRVEVVATKPFEVYGGKYTVNDVRADITFRGLTPPEVWQESTDGRDPIDWQIWSNIAVEAGGSLEVVVRLSGTSWASIGAIRVTSAADPGNEEPGEDPDDDGSDDSGNHGENGDNNDGGANPGGSLSNLSVRSTAGSGDATMVVGFAIGGGTKSVLVRGIGPTLTNFNIPTAITDARLRLFATGTSDAIATNTNWSGDTAVAAAASTAGAFALDASSLDAAFLREMSPGAYSVHIESGDGSPGIALAELYDASVGGTGHLTNVSARSTVGTGNDLLILGFVVAGDAPVTVLIRGIGPTLTDFNISGALADPELKLFADGSTAPVATNDNWSGEATLAATFNTVGAFALSSDVSADAAMVVTLQPGVYTAQLSGVSDTTGIGLLELYFVP